MKKQIENVFRDREETPLFYVESGSRLWDMASPDSDYDVRGFHLQSKRQCFDFKKHRDVIELMDGDFDFVSYDIDKMFALLAKSNPTVLEWIRSDIVYHNELPHWEKLRRDIIENVNFTTLFFHYMSLARGHIKIIESKEKLTYKVLFYCIRGLLSASLASRRVMPPLAIEDLFAQFNEKEEVIKIAKGSLKQKRKKTEKETIAESEKERIISVVRDFAQKVEEEVPEKSNTNTVLMEILTEYITDLKTKYYSI